MLNHLNLKWNNCPFVLLIKDSLMVMGKRMLTCLVFLDSLKVGGRYPLLKRRILLRVELPTSTFVDGRLLNDSWMVINNCKKTHPARTWRKRTSLLLSRKKEKKRFRGEKNSSLGRTGKLKSHIKS